MTYFNISALREAINTPGLVCGSDSLRCIENLRVPICSVPYLQGRILDDEFTTPLCGIQWQNGATFPGAYGAPFDAVVHSIAEISDEASVRKPKFEIQLSLNQNEPAVQHFEAGDSFYVICPNTDIDVEFLLARLDLTYKADLKYCLSCIEGTKKSIPDYVPSKSSIRYILTYCLDIRRTPGRPVVRALAEYCEDAREKRRMLELCSIDGAKEFNQHIQAAGISLIDFLIQFESCRPPVERLVEILPRLFPRAYTAASWDLFVKNRLRFVVSLQRTMAGNGVVYSRYGLCSSYLKSRLNTDNVKLIAKEPTKFRFPLSIKPERTLHDSAVVMVGPGTGIAPFMAFLERFRDMQRKSGINSIVSYRSYLFYGSSNLEKEYIFKEELDMLKHEKIVTDLIICESQPKELESKRPRYVYDALKQQPPEFWDMLFFARPPTFIYACGDVKHMSKQLWECFVDGLIKYKGLNKSSAMALLKKLRDEEFFIEEVWS